MTDMSGAHMEFSCQPFKRDIFRKMPINKHQDVLCKMMLRHPVGLFLVFKQFTIEQDKTSRDQIADGNRHTVIAILVRKYPAHPADNR